DATLARHRRHLVNRRHQPGELVRAEEIFDQDEALLLEIALLLWRHRDRSSRSGHSHARCLLASRGESAQGRRVDFHVTICQARPRWAETSMTGTPKLFGRRFELTVIWAAPVSTTTVPKSCATTSDGTIEA